MRVIIQYNEETSRYLMQPTFHVEHMDSVYAILDIEKKYLKQLNRISDYIEPNFTIHLYGEEACLSEEVLNDEKMILAFIGTKQSNEKIDAYYNMGTHILRPMPKYHASSPIVKCISCYSENNITSAIDYIKCIECLADKANELRLPIMIYAYINVPDETYRYRAITYKIINHYLAHMNGILMIKSITTNINRHYIPWQKTYEMYLDHTLYLEVDLGEAVKKAITFFDSSSNHFRVKDMYRCFRKNQSLYEDTFYESIPKEENIYVIPSYGSYKPVEYYKNLGITSVPLAEDYRVLYAQKRIFNEQSEVIRAEVTPQYQMPILSYGFYDMNLIDKKGIYSLLPEKLPYKGNGVYIGVVGIDGVDYTNEVLCTKDGKSRIACIWEQKEAGEGQYYYQEQINEALSSENPSQIIPFTDKDGITTAILGIAGGLSEGNAYTGVATEAQFLVAKINTASETIQKIYGGVPYEKAVLLPDILVGFSKLREFAKKESKPLVFCIPFNSNIDTHDASFIPNNIISYIGDQPGITIVVPTGEEADKMHHQSIVGKQKDLNTIRIEVKKENQNIIGIICQKLSTILDMTLYSPQDTQIESINIKESGITRLNKGAVIYSNGTHINFSNGMVQTFFRMDNPQVGEWKLDIKLDPTIDSLIDLWISQQELNRYVMLNPSDPLKTLGSTACIDVITAGAYNEESMVVLKNSGRGYSSNDQVRPRLVTHANEIIAPYKKDEWVRMTGTLVAASLMTGVVATLYSKCIEEQIAPIPNTRIMDSIILGILKQFEGTVYPNQSQGYGIFDIKSLKELLTMPFTL